MALTRGQFRWNEISSSFSENINKDLRLILLLLQASCIKSQNTNNNLRFLSPFFSLYQFVGMSTYSGTFSFIEFEMHLVSVCIIGPFRVYFYLALGQFTIQCLSVLLKSHEVNCLVFLYGTVEKLSYPLCSATNDLIMYYTE